MEIIINGPHIWVDIVPHRPRFTAAEESAEAVIPFVWIGSLSTGGRPVWIIIFIPQPLTTRGAEVIPTLPEARGAALAGRVDEGLLQGHQQNSKESQSCYGIGGEKK